MTVGRALRAGTVMAGAVILAAVILATAAPPAGDLAKAPAASGEALTTAAVDGAAFGEPPPGEKRAARAEGPDPVLIKAEILLDRARFSPGAIDGRDGDNFERALAAFAAAHGLPAAPGLGRAVWDALRATGDAPVLRDYTITRADADAPYVAKIPPKMERQAGLKRLGYTNPREMLAERFHMSRDLLSALNPGKDFGAAGTVIRVAAVTPMATGEPSDEARRAEPRVERVEVDKASRSVRALDGQGKLVARYPASIGSTEKPAPSGTTKVLGVAYDPTYTYDPKYRFKGVERTHKFSIAPGPNNPVGLVWIDLAVPSYGIHGTPEPERVGKTASHGCIRLTNWDARDLALHVARGAEVTFKDE